MPINDPWTLLEAARQFRVTIEVRTGTGIQLSHQGAGQLRVERATSSVGSSVTWHEEGHWLTGPLAGIRFHNTTEWRTNPGEPTLQLSHLRRGRPTFLATLRPGPTGSWVADAPHVCGQDLYLPTLNFRAGHLDLVWDVQSPTDPYIMRFEAWARSNSQGPAIAALATIRGSTA
jgi:hypothetical protein